MDKLSKDELMLLAIKFNVPDLIRFCSLCKRINNKIFKQDFIWNYKLKEFNSKIVEYFKIYV